MPFPLPLPNPPSSASGMPDAVPNKLYYVRDPQAWAIDQERMRHNQALYMIGEYTFFVLMWHIEDFNAGLVDRCNLCYKTWGKIADTYAQPAKNKCPACFGSTFEGGFRAIIVRPTIFDDTDEGEKMGSRGVEHGDDVGIETTSDFRVRNLDYVFRQDGSRWQLRVPDRTTVRTGFMFPSQTTAAIDYNNARAQLEDPTSVAYLIPPTSTVVRSVLGSGRFTPEDFSAYEILRAPLIPPVLDALED